MMLARGHAMLTSPGRRAVAPAGFTALIKED